MLPRDERRFKAADLNGDETATREEFTAFLHPEEFEHMKEIVVLVRQKKILGKDQGQSCTQILSLLPKGYWRRTGMWNTCLPSTLVRAD